MTDTIFSYEPLIRPLLQSLNWKGTKRHLEESIPYHHDAMDLQGLRDTLGRLGYTSSIQHVRAASLSESSYPFICLDEQGQAKLITGSTDLSLNKRQNFDAVFFKKLDRSWLPTRGDLSVLRHEIKRFSPLLKEILLISLIIGGISIGPILYNRAVYDHVIASGSAEGASMLFVGVMLALVTEIGLRHMRNNKLAFFGGRLDHYISCSVFERLLFLPPVYTERSSVSSQLARLRDFESVREFFTGPLSTLFFELPLIAVYLTVMAVMGGWLALVPVVLFICYAAVMIGINGKLKHYTRLSAILSTKRQEFLLETVTKLRAIRMAGLEASWQHRYRELSGQASLASFHAGFLAQILETISYGLMIIGGVATLAFGVTMVIDGAMTVGTLIASMMLIWRIIAPLQICCASMTRIQQLSSSTKQVERLLGVQPEHEPNSSVQPMPAFKGAVGFHRVSLKYSPDTEPALLGVSFDIKPGQIIAVKGNNGSGKSTLLKMVLGLYQPQAGSIRIDGMDIRQFDPLNLRQNIAYVPQDGHFFPASIKDNLLFSNPEATEQDMLLALKQACALEEVYSLPDDINTMIEIDNHAVISFALRQKLNLARAYMRPASIYLFDEASYSLGKENDAAFAEKIKSLRGKATVVMATHREDHMRLADTLLIMNKGELTHAGPPEQVLTALKGKRA